jgi:hypothetical protein
MLEIMSWMASAASRSPTIFADHQHHAAATRLEEAVCREQDREIQGHDD